MIYTCGPVNKQIELEISLPEGENKNILFALSGGADSAILLYILTKLDKEAGTNHKFIPFTIPRPDGGANYSPSIVHWINDKLKTNIPDPMIVGDGNLPHQIVVKRGIIDLLNTNKYDIMYLAENRIPDLKIDGLIPTRAPENNYKRVKMPFWDITKDYTIDLYFIENVEELLTLTHSTVGRCGQCFQCNERKWAFNSLVRLDPGST